MDVAAGKAVSVQIERVRRALERERGIGWVARARPAKDHFLFL